MSGGYTPPTRAAMETRWAERDARRASYDAYLDRERARHRSAHIGIVADAFAVKGYPAELALELAAAAVDALLADGVVFARMSTCCE